MALMQERITTVNWFKHEDCTDAVMYLLVVLLLVMKEFFPNSGNVASESEVLHWEVKAEEERLRK